MPAVYAHERFGREVRKILPKELQEIVEKYPTQFRIGLQGPDLFFFYRAWAQNTVRQYGEHLHEISAKSFFEHGCKVIRKIGRNSAEYAYLLGFVCHFILDSECHPYVEMMIEETGVHHFEIEEEFEKKLLRLDGEDALAYPVFDLIPTDRETARAIEPFYSKSADAGLIRSCLRYMHLIKKIFTAPGKLKSGMITSVMKMTGTYDTLKGQMNQRIDNPACEESNRGLLFLFEQAIELAAEMMESLDETIQKGTQINERFDRNFE